MRLRISRSIIFSFLLISAFPVMSSARGTVDEAAAGGGISALPVTSYRQDPQDDRKKGKKEEKEGKKEEKKPEVKEVPKSRRQERPASVKKEERK